MSSLHREVLSSKLHPSKLLPPMSRRPMGTRLYILRISFYILFFFIINFIILILYRSRIRQKDDFIPISWDKYFTTCKKIQVAENEFNIYTLGDSGPLLVLLHGGGYSSLTWSLFAVRKM